MKEYVEYDIEGHKLEHGDKVVTIIKNYRAKGGDVAIAYVHKPKVTDRATLVLKEEELLEEKAPRSYGFYDRLSGKVYKIK